MYSSLTVFFAVSLAAYGFISLWPRKRRGPANHPFPPGPPPVPILGNVMEMDPAAPWASYARWGKIYGNLVYLRFLDQEVIVINSEEVAKDLLERRSYNYSDRPAIMRVTSNFFGWSFNSVAIPYSDRWRLHRRLFHQAFRSQAAFKYHPLQLQRAHDLILNLFETPENYSMHVQTHSTSIIMAVVYGYEPACRDDPIVEIVERAVDLVGAAVRPEVAAFLSFFPFLQYIPPWFPGASLKRAALLCRKYAIDMIEIPFHTVEESLAAGTSVPSMVSEALDRIRGLPASEEHVRAIKESSATAFGAASETTASAVKVFILAMLLNPDVQRRAQAEIDSIVGLTRLPVFEDRPSLLYIEAVLRETLRWHPVAPSGVPHAATNADVYDGYFIPQGATVVANIWGMTRNEAKYVDPERFLPERFFRENGELNDDTMAYVFGGGRRICVGRYIADASLWSAIVSILAVFTIMPCKDERGDDIHVTPHWAVGITSHPHHFPCRFVPRAARGLTAEKLTQMF